MIAYMLTNSRSKGRARTGDGIRNRRHWTLLPLFIGELSLTECAKHAGERLCAGVDVRMAQIPGDTGQYDAFE